MANSRIVFILKRIPSMADPSINDVYPGEHFVTEDSGQLYYKDLQGVIVTVGGGKAVVPSSWTYTPSAKNFAFNLEGSNFLEALEPFSSSIRFLTNSNTAITAGENTITINITKNGSVVATRDFPIVDIIGRELRVASIPTNAICDVLFDGNKFRVYSTYGFGSNASDGSYYFDNDVAVDGSLTVINDKGKKGFAVLEDGTIVVGNDGVKLTNVTDLFQLKGNSTFDGDVNITGRLNVGNRVYSPKGYDGILLSDVPTLDWTKLTNVLPQDKVPAISDSSNKIATTKWVADYIAYLGLTGSGEGGNSTVIDTTIQSTVATEGQTDFDFDYNVGSLLVLSTGHVLVVGEDYTATDGKKIKFTEPCDADEELMFINIGKLDKEKYLTSDQINALITGSNFATTTYVQEQIDALIDGSGDALDTLKELADALNNDPDFATTITNQLAGKRGPLTYIENVLREGLKYEPETYTVMADDETSLHKAFLISCANASQYGNNAYIAPQASMSDGLMDVIIMEPFGLIDAPQISIEMFNKTLDKNNSKIKTFRCKKLRVHRHSPGAIHYDGDPVMTGADIDVELKPKGIKIVVNSQADRNLRKPNALQNAATELFNEINIIREEISKSRLKLQQWSKAVQHKFDL
jgi:hypothetical protein